MQRLPWRLHHGCWSRHILALEFILAKLTVWYGFWHTYIQQPLVNTPKGNPNQKDKAIKRLTHGVSRRKKMKLYIYICIYIYIHIYIYINIIYIYILKCRDWPSKKIFEVLDLSQWKPGLSNCLTRMRFSCFCFKHWSCLLRQLRIAGLVIEFWWLPLFNWSNVDMHLY